MMTITRPKPAPAETSPPGRTKIKAHVPSRDRGIQRHSALLDATERLLLTANPDDIGLYQIAEEAGVPPGSTYHFFPTKDAALYALAQRYFQRFVQATASPIEARKLQSWQDLIEIDMQRAAQLHNDHPPAMKLFYGGYGNLAVRQADIRFNAAIAANTYHRLDTVFHMPHVADPEVKFEIALAIMDATLAISYGRHGRITQQYLAEALDAFTAYCRLFLPARTEPREACRKAAERNETITLEPTVIPDQVVAG